MEVLYIAMNNNNKRTGNVVWTKTGGSLYNSYLQSTMIQGKGKHADQSAMVRHLSKDTVTPIICKVAHATALGSYNIPASALPHFPQRAKAKLVGNKLISLHLCLLSFYFSNLSRSSNKSSNVKSHHSDLFQNMCENIAASLQKNFKIA